MLSPNLKPTVNSDQTVILSGKILAKDLQLTYQKILLHRQSHLKLDGFRQGKVPLDLVTSHYGQNELFAQTVEEVISQIYQSSIVFHHLNPVIPPQVRILSKDFNLEKDLEIEISTCLTPKIAIKSTLYSKISQISPKLDSKAKTEKILSLLETQVNITFPPILLDYEIKKSAPKDKAEFSKKITSEWSINLAIQEIATKEKITVKTEELKQVIGQNSKLQSNPNLIYYLLLQQKVLSFLLGKIPKN